MGEELHRTGVPVAGLVFNDITGKGQSYYGSYGYGYGYGNEASDRSKGGLFKRLFRS